MRTKDAQLTAAQDAATKTPYIVLNFIDVATGLVTHDYSSRKVLIEHHEYPYNDWATIVLNNSDLAVANLLGFYVEIGYGYNTAGGNKSSASPRLWVKTFRNVTVQGGQYVILYLEGMMTRMLETVIAKGTADPPYYVHVYGSSDTIYDCLDDIITTTMGFTLDSGSGSPTQDDSIIDVLQPQLHINMYPFEDARSLVARMLFFTKSFLRPQASLNYNVIFPQAGDAVDYTYISDATPYFLEYENHDPELVPNHIIVFVHQNLETNKWDLDSPVLYGEASDATSIARYYEVFAYFTAGMITTEADGDLIAASILMRKQLEHVHGRFIVPHNSYMELYDRIAFTDNRMGTESYPSLTTARVGSLIHRYGPGEYVLEGVLGGIEADIPTVLSDIARLDQRESRMDEAEARTRIAVDEMLRQQQKMLATEKHPLAKTPEPDMNFDSIFEKSMTETANRLINKTPSQFNTVEDQMKAAYQAVDVSKAIMDKLSKQGGISKSGSITSLSEFRRQQYLGKKQSDTPSIKSTESLSDFIKRIF